MLRGWDRKIFPASGLSARFELSSAPSRHVRGPVHVHFFVEVGLKSEPLIITLGNVAYPSLAVDMRTTSLFSRFLV
jgi:hypothetical protein